MSLQVWLPLNGNLLNKGLSNIQATLLGTNTWPTGKIGNKSFQGGTGTQVINGISLNNNMTDLLSGDYSVAVWIKPTGTHVHYNGAIFSSGNWNYTAYSFGVSQDNSKIDVLCNKYNTYINCLVPVNQWTHICCTRKGNLISLYKNGIFINSLIRLDSPQSDNLTVSTIGRESYANGYFSFNGQLNDFRLYDHCLSLKEIKEISKGLVLHYPLDNSGGLGKNNLLLNTSFQSTYQVTSGWNVEKNGTLLATNWGGYNAGVSNPTTVYHAHLKKIDDLYVYEYIKTADETWLGCNQSGLQTRITAGKTYTFSWLQYCEPGNNYIQTGLYYYKQGASSANFHLGLIYGIVNRQIGKWQKFSRTFVAPEDCDYSKNMSWYIYGHSGNGICYMRRPKLEENNVATPWAPNINDTEYTSLGYNDTTVYDCSGYLNNGTISNIIYSTDTPRYEVSNLFNGVSSNIQGESFTSLIKSVSFWVYFNNLDNQIVFTDYKSKIAFGIFNSYIPVGCTNDGYNTTYNKSILSINTWNHIVLIKDLINNQILLYLNGIKQTKGNTADRWTSNVLDNLKIGARGNNTTFFNGKLSDFRMYVTILSEEDIALLYHTSALADRNSNFYISGSYIEDGYSNLIEYLYNLQKTSGSGTFYQDSDGLHMDGYTFLRHDYIPINPTNKTYKYDIVLSKDVGNQFYIGWERFDANKTSRSNDACIYAIANQTEDSYKRYQGTIDLSTDGVNPCAYIRLRILNKWTGSDTETNGTAILHSLSLKEISSSYSFTPVQVSRQGNTFTTELQLKNLINTYITRTQELNTNFFIEN